MNPTANADIFDQQANDPVFDGIWDELVWRGLVHISTDPKALRKELESRPVTFYCGFDPTAPSLHLGNLVQILIMRRLQLAGHRPLALVGGSTGLVGDPRMSGERVLQPRHRVVEWVGRLESQLSRFLDFSGPNSARLVNNLDWTEPLSAIDFLRDIGRHFRVGTMLKKDAVAARLNSSEGISYTEFSYQVLQGLDFRQLYLDYGCTLQTGGSDQWGNLTSGVDLIHRTERVSVHAFGSPLLTTADGKKFGKSEGNAIWLDPSLTSPWTFYQFWLNTEDSSAGKLLRAFTFLTRQEIESLEACQDSGARRAQRRLAGEVTALVHGRKVTEQIAGAAQALFGQESLLQIDPVILRLALEELPRVTTSPRVLIAELLVKCGLTKSLSESRRAIAQGGVYLNNQRVIAEGATLGEVIESSGPLPDRVAVLRRGRKALAGVFLD